MQPSLIKEGNYYRIEVMLKDDYLYLTLRNYYMGYTIQEYIVKWDYEQLSLTKENTYYRGLAIGVPYANPQTMNYTLINGELIKCYYCITYLNIFS